MKIIRYILATITVLLLGILVASAQTNAPAVLADPVGGDLLHKLTGLYGMLILAAGWVTHANWPRLLAAYEWIGAQGGVLGILCKFFCGSKKIVSICAICAICGLSSGCNTTRFEATRADGTRITVINRRFFWATEAYSCEIGTNSASLTASKSTVDSAAISAAAAGAVEGAAKILSK